MGGVGTGIGGGSGPMANSEGKGVAETAGWFAANGGAGTGTGRGLRSNFSGCVGLSNAHWIPFASTGTTIKIINRARTNKVRPKSMLERFVFMGTLLVNQ